MWLRSHLALQLVDCHFLLIELSLSAEQLQSANRKLLSE